MTRPDFRGARGANAGDDFHELWALREALELLVPDTTLMAVTVEGMHPADAAQTTAATWDGVDCAYYYGAESLATATSFRFDQVKYSSSNPDRAWTVARLTASKRQANRQRSVLGRLGEAFTEIANRRPDLVAADQVRIRLVSNQPVSDEVSNAVAERSSESSAKSRRRQGTTANDARARLAAASRVPERLQSAFFNALDLSSAGVSSRVAAETELLQQIAAWTETDARTLLDGLMRTIRRLMMPEGTGQLITRSDIIAWLGVSDESTLFPCPPAFARLPVQRVSRAVANVVADTLTNGCQRLCIHGSGGVGKTTVLAEVQSLLPTGSHMVSFDCYGGGRYLDAESPRHRPQEAFLQLTNELAARLRLPLLISQSATVRLFANRLRLAAEAIRALSPDGLLVIAIDAADNAVLAAVQHAPPDRSFVEELVRIGALPSNVRLLISTRSSRRDQLGLRPDFTLIEIPPFSAEETERAVRARWPEAPDDWVAEFHALSAGNPRVQAYAFARADSAANSRSQGGIVDGGTASLDASVMASGKAAEHAALAMDALRPRGKDLDAVFAEQFAEAARKSGGVTDLVTIAQALMSLPRPVPLRYLADAAARPLAQVLEFCHDLSPGLRLAENAVNFADEDFESYVRGVAGSIAPVLSRVAAVLTAEAATDPYAAQHLANALFAAGQRAEVIALAQRENGLSVVPDPVVRRDIQLQRLRLAMRVCRDAGKVGDALFTVVRGAAAVQTNHAIKDAFVQYPDLAVRFAETSMRRTVLQQASEYPRHGRLLMHQLAADAERGDRRSAKEGHRIVRAWFHARNAAENSARAAEREPGGGHSEVDTYQSQSDWVIKDVDIAAEIEAVLRLTGEREAINELMRWSPRPVALSVLYTLSTRLAAAHEYRVLEKLLSVRRLAPWDLMIRVPLAMSGQPFDAMQAESSLAQLRRRGLLSPAPRTFDDSDRSGVLFDVVIAACELCVASGSRSAIVRAALEATAARELPTPYVGATAELDRRLRAHALLARLAKETLTPEHLVPRPETATNKAVDERPPVDRADDNVRFAEKRARDERDQETRDLLKPLVPLYHARAGILLDASSSNGLIADSEIGKVMAVLSDAVQTLVRDGHRLRSLYGRKMRGRAAASLMELLGASRLDPSSLWQLAGRVAESQTTEFTTADAVLWTRAGACSALHAQLIDDAASRANAIRTAQQSAPEQVEALARLSQVVCPFSKDDARVLFQSALQAAQQVDPDFTQLVRLCAHMAKLAAPAMDQADRRRLGVDYAVMLEDAAIRLRGYDHFPWASAVEGLAELDLPCAFAAVGRWHDCAVVDLDETLPHVLETGLRRKLLTPEILVAMQYVIGAVPRELPETVVAAVLLSEASTATPSKGRQRRIGEALAELALRNQDRSSHGTETQTWAAIEKLDFSPPEAPWSETLCATVAAHDATSHGDLSDSTGLDPYTLNAAEVDATREYSFGGAGDVRPNESAGPASGTDEATSSLAVAQADIVQAFAWHEFDLGTMDGVRRALLEYSNRTSNGARIARGEVLAAARAVVTPSRRIAYLDAVVGLGEGDHVSADVFVRELIDASTEWGASLAVQQWLTEFIDRLPDVVPVLARHYPYTSGLRRLCRLLRLGAVANARMAADASGLRDDIADRAGKVRDALLLGLEKHVEQMSPTTIYEVVEQVVLSATADESAHAAGLTVSWLASRVAPDHRAPWPLLDLPDAAPAADGRLLYALLGDVDTRVRWRAAHSLRMMATLEADAVLKAAVGEYDRMQEPLFTDAAAPFYWQASRLWLMVALARVAHEHPTSVAQFDAFLLRAGTEAEFPHLLVRWFAREGARAIATAQGGGGGAALAAMDRALGADRPRVRVKSGHAYGGGPTPRRATEGFHFDQIDTVPYWFTPAAAVFVNVDVSAFEAEAATWIVDRWSVRNIDSAWNTQPRRRRLGDGMTTLHRHGSRPRIWRFDTHVEWHSMWCALGSLLPAHSLVSPLRSDPDRTLERMLQREALAFPPFWLADLRGPRPRDRWLTPSAAKQTALAGEVSQSEMRLRAGLSAESHWITVASDVEIGERSYEDTTSVRTALVTPRHAHSLVRALQTVDDPHDFRIPDANDALEIRTPRRRLVGWLARTDDRSGLDEDDPYRRASSGLPLLLPRKLAARLGVRLVVDPFPRWIDDAGQTALRYDLWSGAAPQEWRSHGHLTDGGWRLQVRPDVLGKLLRIARLDLIMEIGITLRTGVHDYRRTHEEETARETKFSHLYLLRAGGELADAHGSIGAWKTHSS